MMSWDQRLDFDEWEERFSEDLKQLQILKEYNELKNKSTESIEKRILYTSILYAQLLNGCRISEAVDAVMQFAQSGEREQRIRARKRRERNKANVLIIIPKSVKRSLRISGSQTQAINAVKCYARNHYHINTHSLRYAWIAEMGREGTPANLVSKAIRHVNLQTIMNYTQEQEADELKRKFIEHRK